MCVFEPDVVQREQQCCWADFESYESDVTAGRFGRGIGRDVGDVEGSMRGEEPLQLEREEGCCGFRRSTLAKLEKLMRCS